MHRCVLTLPHGYCWPTWWSACCTASACFALDHSARALTRFPSICGRLPSAPPPSHVGSRPNPKPEGQYIICKQYVSGEGDENKLWPRCLSLPPNCDALRLSLPPNCDALRLSLSPKTGMFSSHVAAKLTDWCFSHPDGISKKKCGLSCLANPAHRTSGLGPSGKIERVAVAGAPTRLGCE